MLHRPTRRHFLETSTAAGIGFWVAGGIQAEESKSPNEKLQFACVGLGGQGRSDSSGAKRMGEVVAICDIDAKTLEKEGKAKFPGAKRFADFREMLDAMGDQVDAVTVSTPDHTHAAIAARAMKLKKHCYCQKPLTHSIWEARQLAEIAQENGVATQMGNQGTASDKLRKSAAIIQSGALGAIREVHAWTDRSANWWPQGVPRPESSPVPGHVNWDLFLGPAPSRPYAAGYHPFKWRGWWDFGTGSLGDMACHVMNMAFHALDLRDPIAVQATTSGHNQDSYPIWSTIDFEFGENAQRGPLKLKWYDGGKLPEKSLIGGKTPTGNGSIVVGEKGTLYSSSAYGAGYELFGEVEEPKVEFEKSPGHFEEWIRAIRGGKPAVSNFADAGGPLTETILLGNLAVWSATDPETPGKRVEWDAKKMEPTNAPELSKIVRRERRPGFDM